MHFDTYFARTGEQSIPWAASDDGPKSDWHGSIESVFRFRQHGIQAGLELHPGWWGIYLVLGGKFTQTRVDAIHTLTWYQGDERYPDDTYNYRHRQTQWGRTSAIGYETGLAGRLHLIATIATERPSSSGGLRFSLGLRYYPFGQRNATD